MSSVPMVAIWAGFLVVAAASAANTAQRETLPRIGPAPGFTLTDQDGKSFSLKDSVGKVTVVTFIFTSCSSTCPLLTAKLVGIQRTLARDASRVTFAAVTVDPLGDTPAVLKKYAKAMGAQTANFSFLTGSLDQIEDVVRRYAVFRKVQPTGDVDHTFLTSLIDGSGMLRVQYLGSRFDPGEFTQDIRSLLKEPTR
ncbi:MAG: SCO family protein [Burkholderiales bacterium]